MSCINLVIDTEFTSQPEERIDLLTVQVKFREEDQFIEPLKHIYASEKLQKYYDVNKINAFKTRVDNDLIHAPFLQYLRDNGYTVTSLDRVEFSEFILNNRLNRDKKSKCEYIDIEGLDKILIPTNTNKSYRIDSDKIQKIEIMAQFAQAEHGTIFQQNSWYFDSLIKPLCRDGVIYTDLASDRGENVCVKLEHKARLTLASYTYKHDDNFQPVLKPCNWLKGFIIPYLINDKLCVINYFDTVAIFGSLKEAALRCNRERIITLKDTFTRGDNSINDDNHISKIEDAFKGLMPNVSINDAINYAVLSDLEIDFIWDDLANLNSVDDDRLTLCKSQGINIQQHLYLKIHDLQNPDNKFNLIEYSEKTNKFRDCSFKKGNKKVFDYTGSPRNIEDNIDDVKNAHRGLKIVLGGRANNNHPLIQPKPKLNKQSCINNFITDTDIESAYANSIKENILYVGKPELKNYGKKPITLKTFLNSSIYKNLFKCEISGLNNAFIAEINYSDLSFNFDYFASKLKYEDISVDDANELKHYLNLNDLDYSDIQYISQPDPQIKYFTNEVLNGRLTDWDIDFILNCPAITKTQRAELLNKIKVSKLIYHSKSNYVSFNEYCNTDIVTRNSGYLFTTVNLGEIYIKPNLIKRNSYKSKMKGLDKESQEYKKLNALQTQYKLLNNGLYGLLCSDISNISSVITANNITAKCRLQAFLMEKGLSMFQSITDGGTSSLKVPEFSDDGFNISNVSMIYKMGKYCKNFYNLVVRTGKFKFTHILDFKKIEILKTSDKNLIKYDDVIYTVNEFNALTARNQVEHLKNQFNSVKAIENISLELKGIYKSCSTLGTAHYRLESLFNEKPVIKTRGFKSPTLLTVNDDFSIGFETNTIHRVLEECLLHGEKIRIPSPQLEKSLVKLGDIRDKKTKSLLNESRYKSILFCLTTLSPFKFKDHTQFKTWAVKHERDKVNLGLSFERFFFTDDSRKFVNLRATYDFLDKNITDGLIINEALTIDKINECRLHHNMPVLDKKSFKELLKFKPTTKFIHDTLKKSYDMIKGVSIGDTIIVSSCIDKNPIELVKMR